MRNDCIMGATAVTAPVFSLLPAPLSWPLSLFITYNCTHWCPGAHLIKENSQGYDQFSNKNNFWKIVFRTSTPEHFGTGIYLVASLLNHSCLPNCTVVFEGRQLSIVATKDIPTGVLIIMHSNQFVIWTNNKTHVRCVIILTR